tara:strand:- start:19775 stop:20731 length:957 start_codon:yes stop_codon:yes gene_type:complete
MINFLYCFDSNYNIQANNSIYSLLENVSEKINITILHKEIENSSFINKKIINHKKLQNLKVIKFIGSQKFPNLEEAHVSSATYFRLFLSDYISDEIETLVYLDADIVCIKDPLPKISESIGNLSNSNFIIACATEFDENSDENLTRFNMEPVKYFNAGVMIIDNKKWVKNKKTEKLIKELDENKRELKYWDQDLLNIHFFGEYLELNKYLNYKLHLSTVDFKLATPDEVTKSVIFIHYSGKFKPWSLRGAMNNNSSFYHTTYSELFKDKYHIYNNWKGNTLRDLLIYTLNLKIFRSKDSFSLITSCIKSFFKRNRVEN